MLSNVALYINSVLGDVGVNAVRSAVELDLVAVLGQSVLNGGVNVVVSSCENADNVAGLLEQNLNLLAQLGGVILLQLGVVLGITGRVVVFIGIQSVTPM